MNENEGFESLAEKSFNSAIPVDIFMIERLGFMQEERVWEIEDFEDSEYWDEE